MTTQRPKYIAEGFEEDSADLLNEFVDLNCVEFPDFACLWRKHRFSLIFMGRPDHVETSEFVNEIFRITSQYLFSPSFYQQIGAVYILYGLYRNQIADPPIKIRLELKHWKVIKALRNEAISKRYLTLHYVIDYLKDNAFVYVASQTLKGPLTGCMQRASKDEEPVCNLKTNYKSDIMKYSVTSNLPVLRDLQIEYLAEKKNIGSSKRINLSESQEVYEKAVNELFELVNPADKQRRDTLGRRRAKIKAESFMRKSKNRFGIEKDDQDQDLSYGKASSNKRRPRNRRPRRTPKHERRVGRPSKKPKKVIKVEPGSDDEIDIRHLQQQQKDFFLPPQNKDITKKNRTKRDAYYQLSPKREETSDSDSS